MSSRSLVNVLARSFLAGETAVEPIVARGARTLGRHWRWLRPLARRYVASIAGRIRPRHRDVVQFLRHDPGFERALSKHKLSVVDWLAEPPRMQPVPAAHAWEVPAIESAGALADWLGITVTELLWFADLKQLARKTSLEQLRHYHYRGLAKKSGHIRLIEAPKTRLREAQRRILAGILEKIPPHPAAHGFRKGRSIKTFVTPHVGRRVVLRMDLQDFFPTFTAARIQALFRTAGYPDAVADLLAGFCTNATPRDTWRHLACDVDRSLIREARALYAQRHLPQGAPTSPALANLCTYRLDCRLSGLAQAAGADYTRYADDLAFSGGEAFLRCVERFSVHAAAILLEEGFNVNHHKTRIMRQGVRQHLAGLVTNERINVRRSEFDRLKATLTNCVRSGPESQNREAHPSFRSHLEGRVAFVEMINPSRGKRLRLILERILWP
jgi:RNA-directed DNA polymerase